MPNKQLEAMFIEIAEEFPHVKAIYFAQKSKSFLSYYFLTDEFDGNLSDRLAGFEQEMYEEGILVNVQQYKCTAQEAPLWENVWERH